MKRVRTRALAVALIIAVAVGLTAFYVARYALHGGEWVAFTSNGDAYTAGKLKAGRIVDRNGEALYSVTDGRGSYSEDKLTRMALLHSLGDRAGNIGTGAIYKYADRILGYDPVNGIYSAKGEGGTLEMSLDAEVCREAYSALDGRSGAVAVINYVTGEVLCAVSTPSFDPEDPPEIAPDDTSGVYMNRALSAAYTPGSVFKVVTLAAALENIGDIEDRELHCDGTYDIGGGQVTCPKAHGDMKIEDALANSCNCVFGALAVELGGETIAKYAEKYGLLERMEIDGILSAAGKFDIATEGSLNLAWSGVGQYNDLVTPIAMARLMGTIGNSGREVKLTQIKSGPELGRDYERAMMAVTAGKIDKMLDYCVAHTYGDENFPGLELRAKSGTAQVGDGKSNAWFAGYLADPEHPYAFAVCVEKGGGGAAVAGPVANRVLQAAVK